METKAHLKKLPVDHYMISASEVVEHLQNQLGFPIDCDFQLLDNRGPFEKPLATHKCYVLMRVVIRPEDIRVNDQITGYVDQVLHDTSAGISFKDTVINVLKPFMFPEKIADVRNNPQKLAEFAEMGLVGEPLEKLMRRPNIFYDRVNNRFGVYLRPEKIIADMCANPDTNKVDGTVSFGFVSDAAGNAAAISWGVNVYHSNIVGAASVGGVTIDAVFNSIG